jgi:nuclear pore complex protein Nup107
VYFIVSILDRLDLPGSITASCDALRQQHRERVLIDYVGFLRLAGLHDLVPLYCSELEEPHVYEVLHSNLIDVVDDTTRLRQLDLMRKSALSPLSFVIAQANLVLQKFSQYASRPTYNFRIMQSNETSLKYGRPIRTDFFEGGELNPIDYEDDVLIRSLEWQLLVEEAWPGLFATTVRIYKHFLSE